MTFTGASIECKIDSTNGSRVCTPERSTETMSPLSTLANNESNAELLLLTRGICDVAILVPTGPPFIALIEMRLSSRKSKILGPNFPPVYFTRQEKLQKGGD